MSNILFFNIVLVASCGFAFLRGGKPERVVAILFLVAAAATYLVQYEGWRGFRTLVEGILIVDALLFGALVTVALRYDRQWTLWITALQLFTLLIHAARALDPELVFWIYRWAVTKIAYPMLAILVLGALRNPGSPRSRSAERT